MKRILTLFLALSFLVTSFAAGKFSIIVPKKSPSANASEILVPIGKSGQKVSLMELSHMKTKDFEAMSGKKLSLANKVAFKMIQKKLRSSINANGEVNTKIFEKAAKLKKAADDKSGGYLRLWLILLGAAIVLSILGVFVPFIWIIAWLAYLGAGIFFVLWLVNKVS